MSCQARLIFCICPHRGIDYEVIIVDDNSPDGTQDVVKQLQAILGTSVIVRTLLRSHASCMNMCSWQTRQIVVSVHMTSQLALQGMLPAG